MAVIVAVAAVESREQEVEGDSIVSGCFIPERLIQLLFCAPF